MTRIMLTRPEQLRERWILNGERVRPGLRKEIEEHLGRCDIMNRRNVSDKVDHYATARYVRPTAAGETSELSSSSATASAGNRMRITPARLQAAGTRPCGSDPDPNL
jgi:hypothetical protein